MQVRRGPPFRSHDSAGRQPSPGQEGSEARGHRLRMWKTRCSGICGVPESPDRDGDRDLSLPRSGRDQRAAGAGEATPQAVYPSEEIGESPLFSLLQPQSVGPTLPPPPPPLPPTHSSGQGMPDHDV